MKFYIANCTEKLFCWSMGDGCKLRKFQRFLTIRRTAAERDHAQMWEEKSRNFDQMRRVKTHARIVIMLMSNTSNLNAQIARSRVIELLNPRRGSQSHCCGLFTQNQQQCQDHKEASPHVTHVKMLTQRENTFSLDFFWPHLAFASVPIPWKCFLIH